jgi:hypothetical protein
MKNFKYIFLFSLNFFGCYPTEQLPREELIQPKSFNCIVYCDMARKNGCGESESIIYQQKCKKNSDCSKGICISEQCTDTCLNICNSHSINQVPPMLECLMPMDRCDFEYKDFCRS